MLGLGALIASTVLEKPASYTPPIEKDSLVEPEPDTKDSDDLLAKERAELEAEKRRLEELRQQEEAAQQRAREQRIASTTQAWKDLLNVYISFNQLNQPGGNKNASDISLLFKNAVNDIASISTANVDPQLVELIDESEDVFTDFYQLIDTYQQQVTEQDSALGADALTACVSSGMEAETPLGALGKCLVGGFAGGASSAIKAEGSRARLDADTAMNIEQLQARLKQIANKLSQMPKYLDSEYGIRLE
ncbi:hypothetical protein [Allocoleopsis franciscana]|nr:hypothetical protein [Allocoleopsis franciscana]